MPWAKARQGHSALFQMTVIGNSSKVLLDQTISHFSHIKDMFLLKFSFWPFSKMIQHHFKFLFSNSLSREQWLPILETDTAWQVLDIASTWQPVRFLMILPSPLKYGLDPIGCHLMNRIHQKLYQKNVSSQANSQDDHGFHSLGSSHALSSLRLGVSGAMLPEAL